MFRTCIAASALLLAACSGSTPKATDSENQCPKLESHGFTGTDECKERIKPWVEIPDAHRLCTSDSDCALINKGCDILAVADAQESRYAQLVGTCNAPNAGECGPAHVETYCNAGCCAYKDKPLVMP